MIEENNFSNVRGLDIGTGANCIYPLLGNKIYKWIYKASDINEESLEIAKIIVEKNNLTNSVELVRQKNENCIFKDVVKHNEYFHFSMCNPPYFSYDEVKHDNPKTVILLKLNFRYVNITKKKFTVKEANYNLSKI